jgi:hypothetical protein
MVTTAMAVRVDASQYLPRLVSVTSTWGVDVVRVRMLPGQTLTAWASNAPPARADLRGPRLPGAFRPRPRTSPGAVVPAVRPAHRPDRAPLTSRTAAAPWTWPRCLWR